MNFLTRLRPRPLARANSAFGLRQCARALRDAALGLDGYPKKFIGPHPETCGACSKPHAKIQASERGRGLNISDVRSPKGEFPKCTEDDRACRKGFSPGALLWVTFLGHARKVMRVHISCYNHQPAGKRPRGKQKGSASSHFLTSSFFTSHMNSSK